MISRMKRANKCANSLGGHRHQQQQMTTQTETETRAHFAALLQNVARASVTRPPHSASFLLLNYR